MPGELTALRDRIAHRALAGQVAAAAARAPIVRPGSLDKHPAVRRAIRFLATGAYVGRVPVASGTFGSLLAIPLLVGLPALGLPATLQLLIIAGTVPLAMLVCHRASSEYEEVDSGQIVLDEICGMLVAGALIVPSLRSLGLAFLVFRALDILKPFPASYFDRHAKNGFGIVADDVCAGLYTNLVVRALS